MRPIHSSQHSYNVCVRSKYSVERDDTFSRRPMQNNSVSTRKAVASDSEVATDSTITNTRQ